MLEHDKVGQLEPWKLEPHLEPPVFAWLDETVRLTRELAALAAQILRTHPLTVDTLGEWKQCPEGGFDFALPDPPMTDPAQKKAYTSAMYLAQFLDGGTSNSAILLFGYLRDARNYRRLQTKIEACHTAIHAWEETLTSGQATA